MSNLLEQAKAIKHKLKLARLHADKVHVTRHENGGFTIHRNDGSDLTYKPEPTFLQYHDDKSFVKHAMGPYSSGKSVGCLADTFNDLMNMPACKDGIRRARTGIMRSTYNELHTTTIKTFLDWYGDFGYVPPGRAKTFIKMPYPTFSVRFNDGFGVCEWEVYFLAFENESDVDKLGSWELTNGYVNEARGFPKAIYDAASGRIGRYPKLTELKDATNYYHSLKSDTNAPTPTHWLYDLFEIQKPEGYKIWKQAPAIVENETTGRFELNPNADNLSHNKPDYYLNMIKGKTREFIRVYAQGFYGAAAEGKKVFEDYNDDIHSVESIEWAEDQPLYLGWDFGLTPCLLVMQIIDGQLRCLKEFVTERMGIENLIESKVKPFWVANKLDKYKIAASKADPAGAAKNPKNIELPDLIQVVTNTFTKTEKAITNHTETRLEATRSFLLKSPHGQPGLLIDRQGCPILREGFNGFYKLEEKQIKGKGDKMYVLKPCKSHPHSEPQDCLQYIALDFFQPAINDGSKEDEEELQIVKSRLSRAISHGNRKAPKFITAA